MARTSSVYDHFIIWPSSVTLSFVLPKQMFQMALLLLNENNCAKSFWNAWINVKVMARTSSVYDYFIIWPSCDLDIQPTWTNVSNGTSTCQGKQLCQIILKFMHKCRLMARTIPDGRTDTRTHNTRTHIHRTEVVTTLSRAPQADSTKIQTQSLVRVYTYRYTSG